VNKRKKRFLFWLLIVLLIGNAVVYAPRYLLYSSDYRKADAIVLFLGPDFTARQKEAYKIIHEGMADYLIIPAYNKVYRVSDKETIKSLPPNLSLRNSIKKRTLINPPSPYFYEDTHIEAIEAKKTMADFRLKSAIFVSSPYHMRRIKLIASKVFTGEQDGFYFAPTIYEKAPGSFWELSGADWRKVGWEYIKMIWFSIYIVWAK
jgi:hypothetical protein